MTSFALRSSDNALVWVKDAPEKPAPNYEHSKSSIYKDTQWYKETGGYKDPTEWYKSALKQAIRDGIVVADQKQIASLIFVKEYGGNLAWCAKPDTLYHLEVEMEERWEYRPYVTWTPCTESIAKLTNYPSRSFALIAEPKEEKAPLPSLIPKDKEEAFSLWLERGDITGDEARKLVEPRTKLTPPEQD